MKRTPSLRAGVRFGFATPAAPGFPRMLRIRHDQPLHEADTLQGLHDLMQHAAGNNTGETP